MDFTMFDIKFHLNENPPSEFGTKYTLLWWNDFRSRWQQCAQVDSLREARSWVKSNKYYF